METDCVIFFKILSNPRGLIYPVYGHSNGERHIRQRRSLIDRIAMYNFLYIPMEMLLSVL